MTFGAFIRERRKALQMTIQELAFRAGISTPFVADLEYGHRTASQKTIRGLADALSVSRGALTIMAGHIPEEMMPLMTFEAACEIEAATGRELIKACHQITSTSGASSSGGQKK